ncbi:MAG: hypothetical protein ACE5H2_00775 [Terriglobia bacterium]
MKTLDNRENWVAFAVCQTEAEGNPVVDHSSDGQYFIFRHLSQAEDFLFHRRLFSGWHIVPVLLGLPLPPTELDFHVRTQLSMPRQHLRNKPAA